MKFTSDENMIYFSAFRYALGRRTYIVSWTVDVLDRVWHRFDRQTKVLILGEIKYALNNGLAGMKMDEQQWERLLEKPYD